jgi:cobalt/nickel transport protein
MLLSRRYRMKRKNMLLIGTCILIVLISLFIGQRMGELEGADGKVEEKVVEINGDYKPWIQSIWTPPSGEVESLLFALQAAAGAGFIGYYLGRKKNDKNNNGLCKDKQII